MTSTLASVFHCPPYQDVFAHMGVDMAAPVREYVHEGYAGTLLDNEARCAYKDIDWRGWVLLDTEEYCELWHDHKLRMTVQACRFYIEVGLAHKDGDARYYTTDNVGGHLEQAGRTVVGLYQEDWLEEELWVLGS